MRLSLLHRDIEKGFVDVTGMHTNKNLPTAAAERWMYRRVERFGHDTVITARHSGLRNHARTTTQSSRNY